VTTTPLTTAALRARLFGVVADTGVARLDDDDIPTDGPPTTYVVIIVPHFDEVFPHPDEYEYAEDAEPFVDPQWGNITMEGSRSVEVFAVLDEHVDAGDRQLLRAADGYYSNPLEYTGVDAKGYGPPSMVVTIVLPPDVDPDA
jgi:hypothetical protein